LVLPVFILTSDQSRQFFQAGRQISCTEPTAEAGPKRSMARVTDVGSKIVSC
jgi:hypothetical protein